MTNSKKKPKFNGCVERANGTTRYDFYPFYEGSLTIEAINKFLAKYQDFYNHYRPHDSIGLELLSQTHAGGLICLIGTEPGQ